MGLSLIPSYCLCHVTHLLCASGSESVKKIETG